MMYALEKIPQKMWPLFINVEVTCKMREIKVLTKSKLKVGIESWDLDSSNVTFSIYPIEMIAVLIYF